MSALNLRCFLPIQKAADVDRLRQEAVALGKHVGLHPSDLGTLGLAVSEIGTNALKYAQKAEASVELTRDGAGVRFVMVDSGPGIPDIEQAMRDGHSTGGSLGMGLGAARRAADHFSLTSSPRGTCVVVEKYRRKNPSVMDFAALTSPRSGMTANGDQHEAYGFDGESMLVALVDGHGSGEPAERSSKLALQVIGRYATLPLDLMIESVHQALAAEPDMRGSELILARFVPPVLSLAGVGNLGAVLRADQEYTYRPQMGCCGLVLPGRIRVKSFEIMKRFDLFLHTDGVAGAFYNDLPDARCMADEMARYIFDKHSRRSDDATIAVLRYGKGK